MDSFSTGSFLQGFLEEAADHLENIHACLLRMEEADPIEQAELVDDLFRSFHTLKGLSGMVGLENAATLSHAMETVLNAIKNKQVAIDSVLVDQLLASTSTFSAVIETIQDPRRAMPDIQPDLAKLEAIAHEQPQKPPATPEAPKPPTISASPSLEHALSAAPAEMLPGLAAYPDLVKNLSDLDLRKIEAEIRAGQVFTLVMFVPSPQRAERGENVDLARQQITNAGKLIKAVPVMKGGAIHFLFLVTSAQSIDAGTIIADEVIPLAAQSPELPATLPQASTVVPAPRQSREPVRGSQVRVGLDRLDALMRYAGDLVVQRARLEDAVGRLSHLLPAERRRLREIQQQMGRTLRDLRRAILYARMVPLGEAFNQMPLVARDLARASQKEVRLIIQGETTELDKMLVERLLDPLIHLVRNAITHGIEPPAERAELGKPRVGTLTLRGMPHGDRILVEVSDDGRGVDLSRVEARAAELGRPQNGHAMTAEEALDWITRPGFSTKTQADLAAGRGVGLDVAARMVRAFGGRLSLETNPGLGSTFRMALPLTLVIQDVLFVRVGDERYGISQDSVDHVVEINEGNVVRAEAGEMLLKEDEFFVLHRLSDWFGIRQEPETPPTNVRARQKRAFGLVCAAEKDGSRPVLVVDRVETIREAVVAPLVDPLVTQPGISGATEMGDGQVVLILDVPGLLNQLRKDRTNA